MLLTRETLPQTIPDIAALDELLCRPSQALIDDLRKVDGDIMILGVAGKMGPTLAGLAKAAAPERRVIGVARFSDPAVKDWLQARGVETINCDLLDEAAIKALPKVPNIVFMAGRKFGAEGDLSLTWAMNSHVPALVAQALPNSRIVAFSTGCVYPFVPVDGKGSTEDMAPNPPGEYAQSCVGRERMFEYFSKKHSTPGRLFRLNYAIDMRYGVLHDIASKVLQGKPIDVSLGHVNFIWQGDASAQALRCLAHCETPTSPINVSGHEILAVRDLAAKFGQRFGRAPVHRRQGRADGVAHRYLAGRETVRPAGRRHRAADQLDRRLGVAVDAEPRQAHQIRGARWPLLSRSTSSQLGVGDAQAGLVLSTEAHWNQNEADWRFFLSQGVVFGVRDGARLVATAALLPYSAGNAWISMVLVTADFRRRGIATKLVDACLDAAAKRGLDHLARRDAGRRHRLRPARLQADAAIATAAADGAARRRASTPLSDGTSTPWPRAMPAPWDSTAAHCCRNFPRARARASCLTASHRARPRWTHRASYRPAAGRSSPIRRSRWWMPSSAPRPGRG